MGVVVLVEIQSFGIGARYKLEILHQFVKRVKTKSQKVLVLILTFAEVTGEKLVGGPFCPSPILNRVKAPLSSLRLIQAFLD